jgi:hypothetical protein
MAARTWHYVALIVLVLLVVLWNDRELPPRQAAEPVAKPSVLIGRIFAPYVYMGAGNDDLPAISQASGIKHFILAFIVSKPRTCRAIWAEGMPVATESDVAAKITALRSAGGDVAIALGGQGAVDLAQSCNDPAELQTQYQAVIDKYGVRWLDFDVESKALRDAASIDRRSVAIVALQRANPGLMVSFTLEASPDGLTDESVAVLKNLAQRHVPVDVVNAMAMDYGPDENPRAMGQYAIAAAGHALEQMKSADVNAGLGVTVMIGRNDVRPEVFTLDDAQKVLGFARGNSKIRLLSIWSAGRDKSCSKNVRKVSPVCSGVPQQPYEFSHIFENF